MRRLSVVFVLFLLCGAAKAETFFSHQFQSIAGESVDFSSFKGKVILVVNTASKCGFTDQYEGLQKLYEEKKEQGLVVLGFPSNDFGGQEPGSDEQIASFCKANFGVEFPLFSKSPVKGESKNPVFKWLVAQSNNLDAEGEVRWNFEKFVISREGKLVGRFRSFTTPESKKLRSIIDRELSSGA